MKGTFLVSDGESKRIVTLDYYHDKYYSLVYKPETQSEEEFIRQAISDLSQHSKVGSLMPVPFMEVNDLYLISSVTKDPAELGYNTALPPIHSSELSQIKSEMVKGNLGVLDFKKNQIYENSISDENAKIVLPDFEEINAELIKYLIKHPHFLNELHWRKFEVLLDTLFKAKGYETVLGPGSGDGGVDIRMISNTRIEAPILTLVQAKRHAAHNKVKLQPVQALYGVLEDEKATNGIFVTTSDYEPCARRFAESKPFRLQLAGPGEIQKWLKDYVNCD